MPRSQEDLAKETAAAEEWLDNLDPDDPNLIVDNPADLRAIAETIDARTAVDRSLTTAVASARRNGRSWARIGAALGVSKQAAQKRYGDDDPQPSALPDPRSEDESSRVTPPGAVSGVPRVTPPGAVGGVSSGVSIKLFRDSDGMYRYRRVVVDISSPFETEEAARAAVEELQRPVPPMIPMRGPVRGPVRSRSD